MICNMICNKIINRVIHEFLKKVKLFKSRTNIEKLYKKKLNTKRN